MSASAFELSRLALKASKFKVALENAGLQESANLMREVLRSIVSAGLKKYDEEKL